MEISASDSLQVLFNEFDEFVADRPYLQPVLDSDRDGLTDEQELALGSSALSADSDRDGLTDKQELQKGTDPLIPDSDRDGLPDGVEVSQGKDPLSEDVSPPSNVVSEVTEAVVAMAVVREVAESYSPTRGELMDWYVAAQIQEQPPEQLSNIKALGQAQIQGTGQEFKPSVERDSDFKNPSFTLSPEDLNAMKSTMATFQQQLQQVSEEAPEQTSGDRER
jgi:hypothetical protein